MTFNKLVILIINVINTMSRKVILNVIKSYKMKEEEEEEREGEKRIVYGKQWVKQKKIKLVFSCYYKIATA